MDRVRKKTVSFFEPQCIVISAIISLHDCNSLRVTATELLSGTITLHRCKSSSARQLVGLNCYIGQVKSMGHRTTQFSISCSYESLVRVSINI